MSNEKTPPTASAPLTQKVQAFDVLAHPFLSSAPERLILLRNREMCAAMLTYSGCPGAKVTAPRTALLLYLALRRF